MPHLLFHLLQIMFLEDLGCESSLIFQDNSGQVYNLGSSAGYSFICLNPDINIKFIKQLQPIVEKKSEIKFVITGNANVNLQSNRDVIPSPTQPKTVVTVLFRIADNVQKG